jgi:hypothetical protein
MAANNEDAKLEKRVNGAGQQPLGPVTLPVEALVEVFRWLSRSQRAQRVLVNRQTAAAIVPEVNAEREKVSSLSTTATIPPLTLPITHSRSSLLPRLPYPTTNRSWKSSTVKATPSLTNG